MINLFLFVGVFSVVTLLVAFAAAFVLLLLQNGVLLNMCRYMEMISLVKCFSVIFASHGGRGVFSLSYLL